MRWAILPAALLLPSCAILAPRERIVLQPCNPVPLAVYSRDDQARLARELAGLGDDAMARRAIEDGGVLRAQLRLFDACGDLTPAPRAALPQASVEALR